MKKVRFKRNFYGNGIRYYTRDNPHQVPDDLELPSDAEVQNESGEWEVVNPEKAGHVERELIRPDPGGEDRPTARTTRKVGEQDREVTRNVANQPSPAKPPPTGDDKKKMDL